MTTISPEPRPAIPGLWKVVQYLGLAATAALLAGLLVQPGVSLSVLWNALIPLVPASLLVSPALWRNVCPLATLNLLTSGSARSRALDASLLPAAGGVGILLLVVMVPARRFLFNTDGTALAITIACVALTAMVLGRLFRRKSGFCNAICPVLPVERLYGQHPLVRVDNARCSPCTTCTAFACIDIDPSESVDETLGHARRTRSWLTSIFGAFAAMFPGFVIGYYTTRDGPLGSAGSVFLHVGLWMAVSYGVACLLILLLKASARVAISVLAATAVGLYYWFAADVVTTAFGVAGTATTIVRAVMLTLAVVWLWRALLGIRDEESQASPRMGP